MLRYIYFLPLFLISSTVLAGQNRHYDLTISKCEVNLSSKETVNFALCVNGGIPGPILEFTEGDFAEIKIKNDLEEETSVHWHGILLPNEMDGVSFVTTLPIKAKSEHIFTFPIRQSGTYWYHSHTGLQEQRGVFGSIVIHPKAKPAIQVDKEYVAILSDWIDENPDQVLRNLKKDGDYYRFKKKRIPSWWDAWKQDSLGDLTQSEWTRMGAMDLSDVGYDRFLVNGKALDKIDLKPGQKLRLRLINGAASTYFYVQVGQQPFAVIASDGIDVEPVIVKELLIGMGETYDLLITGPDAKALQLRATAQDISGYTSVQIGTGNLESPIPKSIPNPYRMEHGAGHAGHMMHGGMDHSMHGMTHEDMSEKSAPPEHSSHQMNHDDMDRMEDMEGMGHGEHDAHSSHEMAIDPTVHDKLSTNLLKPLNMPSYPKDATKHEFKFKLQGDMERYTWALENADMDDHKSVYVKKGELIRFEMKNETMMHHPMHLHGHFFKVMSDNAPGDPSKAALKHTVDVPPHSTKVIEFYTDEPGYWLFHCHNLYHMKSGMDAQVRYQDFSPKPELHEVMHKDPHQHEHIYNYGRFELFTNESSLYLRSSTSKWQFDGNVIYEFKEKALSSDLLLHRWLSNYANVFAGVIYTDEKFGPLVGFYYLLPFRIDSELTFDTIRKLGVKAGKEFVLTQYVETDLNMAWNKHDGFVPQAELFYRYNWNLKFGLKWEPSKITVGAVAQF